MTPAATSKDRRLLWLIFFVSGFAGLIYESIWTHYLKLFLGHAAYAQTIVLGIFMSGMAAGSALASRFSSRLKNPLKAYALVEALIGCLALAFHPTFETATNWFYGAATAAGDAGGTFALVKWGMAALLILPQSMLLGATFPLFAAAATRASDTGQGRVIATLYFANSLGGAVGILLSGFLLVPAIGLPGTIVTAGAMNFLIAAVSLRITRTAALPATPAPASRRPLGGEGWFLLGVSFLTGASSFIYEVGWIRMLSLSLGSATHSFELMLSAFITGLAVGGLWIRKRIDDVPSPGVLLGYVQLAMGCAAIATLPLHNLSFDFVAWLIKSTPRTDGGYALFNLARYGVAALIMFPAAFCAGMTLPLVTRMLYAHRGQQERAIGLVYSANTIGAISGLAFAVLVGLPSIGLDYLVASGAMVDVLLGVALLAVFGGARNWRLSLAATLACGVGTVVAAATFNPEKLVSGVFRDGQARIKGKIVEIAHGRTATISTEAAEDGAITIRTNGKADASAVTGFPARYKIDEVTMTLIGAVPLMLHPQPRRVANIGFGSGITGETLLGDPRVQQLDTIEIEPRMVDLARHFTGRNDRVYADPRSHIHIDDAKAYFAAAGKRYDLIVSEPSNPWVSGVASLFSQEFYRHVVRYMEKEGLFAQWLQVYESHPDRVASVLKAVGETFDDYLVVALDYGDILIIARPQGKIAAADVDAARLSPQIRQWMARLDVATQADVTVRIMGNKALFAPWVDRKAVPANSDFFPYVDAHADHDRFIGKSADLLGVALSAYPIPEAFGVRPSLAARSMLSVNEHFGARSPVLHGRLIAETLFGHSDPQVRPLPGELSPEWRQEAGKLLDDCRNPPMNDGPYAVAGLLIKVLPYLSPAEGRAVVATLAQASCFATLSAAQQPWATLVAALLDRDPPAFGRAAEQLLRSGQGATPVRARYLLGMAMLGDLAGERSGRALALWDKYAPAILGDKPPGIELELLHAHAVMQSGRSPLRR